VLRRFDTVGAALVPCGAPGCTGNHVVAYLESSVPSVDCPLARQPPSLAVLLSRLYPRGLASTPSPQYWPAPAHLNTPLRKGLAMTPAELRAAQHAAVAAAGDRQLEPHPRGLPGRVADAQAEAEAAFAVGNIDGAIGSDQLAAALTDADDDTGD
jgi:hypothetical protein